MKIRIEATPDSDIKIEEDEAGNVAVTITPTFGKKTGHATIGYGTVKNDAGVVLDKFMLSVSGKTGLLTKQGRRQGVTAAVDEGAPEPADKPKPKKGGSDERPEEKRG